MASHTVFQRVQKTKRPQLAPRELAVLGIVATIVVLVPWAWGGVVLWAVNLAFGLAVAAIIAAVGNHRAQCIAAGLWAVAALTLLAWPTELPELAGSTLWMEKMAFPLAAFVGQLLPAVLYAGDTTSRPSAECWRGWVRSVPFWVGIALFSYFTVQALNPWGVVVERDLFWRIFREQPVSWLPSGLRAPFISDGVDPGGMNAWRIILIFAGPWLVFGALRAGLRRRRGLVFLMWLSIGTGTVFALFGVLNQKSYSESILGHPLPSMTTSFGTFFNRNHAGVYLYLQAALALALAFWLLRQSRNSLQQGGPYLLAAFSAIFLTVFALFTNSIGAAGVLFALFLIAVPFAYLRGMPLDGRSRREVSWVAAIAFIFIATVFIYTGDFRSLVAKASHKAESYQLAGADDRAPLRRSTWEMATVGGWTGKVWTGWGAGSYRWVSPVFQAEEKVQQNTKGKLVIRATYAHCDWLQMLAEWGILGLTPVVVGLWWLGRRIRRACHRGHPEAIPLAAVLVLVCLHASVELILWFTPLLYSIALVAAAMIMFTEHDINSVAAVGPEPTD